MDFFLYGSEKFNFNLNKELIKLTICYLKGPNVLVRVSSDLSFFLFIVSFKGFFCFFIYIYVFPTYSGLAEKRTRFTQGFTLVC